MERPGESAAEVAAAMEFAAEQAMRACAGRFVRDREELFQAILADWLQAIDHLPNRFEGMGDPESEVRVQLRRAIERGRWRERAEEKRGKLVCELHADIPESAQRRAKEDVSLRLGLLEAIDGLPAVQSQIMRLRREERTFAEIAQLISMPVGTVHRQYEEAKKTLAAVLRRGGE